MAARRAARPRNECRAPPADRRRDGHDCHEPVASRRRRVRHAIRATRRVSRANGPRAREENRQGRRCASRPTERVRRPDDAASPSSCHAAPGRRPREMPRPSQREDRPRAACRDAPRTPRARASARVAHRRRPRSASPLIRRRARARAAFGECGRPAFRTTRGRDCGRRPTETRAALAASAS